MTDFRDIALADLADELAAVCEQRDAYREMAQVALARLAAETTICERQKRRLHDQSRQIRDLMGMDGVAEAAA